MTQEAKDTVMTPEEAYETVKPHRAIIGAGAHDVWKSEWAIAQAQNEGFKAGEAKGQAMCQARVEKIFRKIEGKMYNREPANDYEGRF